MKKNWVLFIVLLATALFFLVGSKKASQDNSVIDTAIGKKNLTHLTSQEYKNIVQSNKQEPFTASSLPPPNMPLNSIIDELKLSSSAGNYRASCRLAMELLRCKLSAYHDASIERIVSQQSQKNISDSDVLKLQTSLENAQATKLRDQQVCNGFTNAQGLKIDEYLLNAANAGHLPSMEAYSTDLTVHDIPLLTTDPNKWQQYRANASGFLIEAASQGSRWAIYDLLNEYAGDSEWKLYTNGKFGLLEADPILAVTYAILNIEFATNDLASRQRRLQKLESKLDLKQLQTARENAVAIKATWNRVSIAEKNKLTKKSGNRSYDEMCEK
jgi:hypothetical protein